MRRLTLALCATITLIGCAPNQDQAVQAMNLGPEQYQQIGVPTPDLGGVNPLPDLAEPPADLTPPPPDQSQPPIANGMDCSGLKPSYTCATAGGYVSCVQVKMDRGACFINCDNTFVWRISPPMDVQSAPDHRFWLDSVAHFKYAGEINDCLP